MKIVIVGGGITGLSAAWFLNKRYGKNAKITLLEKTNRLGGWIQTDYEKGLLFERGPRTFQFGKCETLLKLIQQLGLTVIRSDPTANKRYLFHQGRLRSMGSFIPLLFPYAIRELFLPRGKGDDESIYDFASRRFSPKIADTLFDPLTLGVYAGDIRKLSIRACFPTLFNWEKEKGSVIRGLFSAPKREKGLFTLQNGMQTLIDELQKQLPIEIVLNCKAEVIKDNEVLAGGKIWTADLVIRALPPEIPAKSIWVVNLAFHGKGLSKKGFGYLVPSQEKESVLGAIFDSSIFPQQNGSDETRMTVMVREEEKKPLEAALRGVERHLKIRDKPFYSSVFYAQKAIPQFEVGCGYVDGISVEACVQRGIRFSLQD